MSTAKKQITLYEYDNRLVKEWHPTKNGILTPLDVSAKSGKKVWWLCEFGHEWEAKIYNRSYGTKCPYCSGKKACDDNSLVFLNPTLAHEWHPEKNKSLKPSEVVCYSNKKVWWICEKKHEWQASICSRSQGANCPFCSGLYPTIDHNLSVLNPKLANEWHPTKNGLLTPKNVSPKAKKKVWWKCKRDHEWQAAIYSRAIGNSCPICNSQTSAPELRIFSEIVYFFEDSKLREKIENREADVYIPQIKLAIEIDGAYWHKNKKDLDKKKNDFFNLSNIKIIRIREKGLNKISDWDIIYEKKVIQFNIIKQLLEIIIMNFNLTNKQKTIISSYIAKEEFVNSELFYDLLDRLPSPITGTSLADINPKLIDEWDYNKNGNLTPYDVFPNSEMKVWWKCEQNHEWQAIIGSRNTGRNCPYCSGNVISFEKSLQAVNPLLLKEWDYHKNKEISPDKIFPNSEIKVWWKCEQNHEWQARITNRHNGTNCPYCSGNKACKDNSLSTLNPILSEEWHPSKNDDLTPENITVSSGKKVWWLCKEGHEWQATVSHRNNGRGCPFCYNENRKKNKGGYIL
jgi:positive regulator of sigma E activity